MYENTLYENVIAVTDRKQFRRPFIEQIERICLCHPKAVILREKDLSEEEYFLLAKETLKICREHNIVCILHTFLFSAKKLGCDSIHLPLSVLEKYQGELAGFRSVGTSVHSVEEALKGKRLGATYLTVGHIYNTLCKKGVPPRGIDFLKNVCCSVELPIYAIGGIKADRKQIEEVMACGAKGVCIMSAMARL